MLIPHNPPPEELQPADGAFDLPAAAVPSQLASVLSLWSPAAPAVRADEIPAALPQPFAGTIAVAGAIGNQRDALAPLR